MKLVFLGTPRAAVPALHALIEDGHDVALVVTQPDRPFGRTRRPQPPPVKRVALELGLALSQPRKVRDEPFRESIRTHRPDLLVVVAYGRILPGPVLRVARRGAVNVHFSLLPAYRGAAPVQWALARGERVTGVSTMMMNERMDEGDLLLQKEVAIEPGEHAPALGDRLAQTGAALLLETLRGIEAGTLTPRPQRHEQATLAPLLTREDGEVGPGMDAAEIEGRVRGFDPWPGVWMRCGSRRVRLVEVRRLDGLDRENPPGTLTELLPGGLVLVCGRGTRLLVTRVQLEGRRATGARDAVNGRQLRVGDRLDGPPDRS